MASAGRWRFPRDGKRIADRARSGMTSPIVVRELDGFEFKRLSGTDYASDVFFSPDGKWVGFVNWSDPLQDSRGVHKYSLVGGFSTTILPERGAWPAW